MTSAIPFQKSNTQSYFDATTKSPGIHGSLSKVYLDPQAHRKSHPLSHTWPGLPRCPICQRGPICHSVKVVSSDEHQVKIGPFWYGIHRFFNNELIDAAAVGSIVSLTSVGCSSNELVCEAAAAEETVMRTASPTMLKNLGVRLKSTVCPSRSQSASGYTRIPL